MLLSKKSNNSRTSSRRNIDIRGVDQGILMLPGEHYRAILQVSSINFDLKSEAEQQAIVATYQSFLNSLKFPIQIVIRTRAMDMDKYIADFRDKLEDETDEVYRQQIENYTKFVKRLIKTNKILSRQFYVVVPYDAVKEQGIEVIKEELALHCSIVENGLKRLGMTVRLLTSVELLDLFYSFYSPHQAKVQPITNITMDAIKKSYV